MAQAGQELCVTQRSLGISFPAVEMTGVSPIPHYIFVLLVCD